MQTGLVMFIVFFLLTVLAGMNFSRSPKSDSAVSFYLGGRSLGVFSLFLTMAATNFSAFTVLGLSGAGFRSGYVFYPVMAAGTGYMAISMYLAGSPMARLGKVRGWITPVDCVSDRFGSGVLSVVYALALVLFTLPYLALQPMAAGMLLESAYGIPYRTGVLAVGTLVGLYTIWGGLRSVVRTDVFHGLLFFVLAAVAWGILVHRLGGFSRAHETALVLAPWRFGRPGGMPQGTGLDSPYGIGFAGWIGYFVLWFLADPLFPQLGQRFLAARDVKSLRRTALMYPFVTAILFFFTVSFGVLAGVVMPEVGVAEADRIWPLTVVKLVPGWLSSLLLLAPLAALMTTMDSQLLTLASILDRNIIGGFLVAWRGRSEGSAGGWRTKRAGQGAGTGRREDARNDVVSGQKERDWQGAGTGHKTGAGRSRRTGIARLCVLGLCSVGMVMALDPPVDILNFLNKNAFSGYAALAPVAFGALYSRYAGAGIAGASMAAGLGMLALSGSGLVRFSGIPDIIPVVMAGWAVFFCGSFLKGFRHRSRDFEVFHAQKNKSGTGWGEGSVLAGTPGTGAGTVCLDTPGKGRARMPADTSWKEAENGQVDNPGSGESFARLPKPASFGLFLLALLPVLDFWNWGKIQTPILGLPPWMWLSVLCCLLSSLALALHFRIEDRS